MKSLNRYILALIPAMACLMAVGCVTIKSNGPASAPGYKGGTITLAEIRSHAEDFDIYWAGLSDDMPTAIFFDPKDDDKRIIGDRWEKVTEPEKLDGMISFVESYLQFDPRLFALIGPNKEVFGYVFSPNFIIQTKLVNENTIYIYDIKSPLYLDDGRPAERLEGKI
ncbi:MAG: hypothetical protein DRH12_10375 [Deltaproteobacteria bacterium]|nr:MAG: hypothetical protein DRH12_10375 [Deltaproteobacteria bacterium]RLB81787.1 MAG: hypothetical protein DRH15_06480 [Deltaproteobacteria bacterium]